MQGFARRHRWIVLCGTIAAVGFVLNPVADVIVYNHSPSIPIGFYVRTEAPIARGSIVTVRAREVAPEIAASQRFDDDNDRFLKRVAALFGDEVCTQGDRVSINGAIVARRLSAGEGDALPTWTGCVTLGANEYLLMGDTADSFDSRYWGVVSVGKIEGVWRPLLLRKHARDR